MSSKNPIEPSSPREEKLWEALGLRIHDGRFQSLSFVTEKKLGYPKPGWYVMTTRPATVPEGFMWRELLNPSSDL